jgi:hypothetical protein
MSRLDVDDLAAIGGLIVFVLMITFVAVIGITSARLKAACLQAGYPAKELTWNFERYCVKRVDQTDIVIRLDDLPQ